ncbi:methicillin resistance protein [Bifidobacterium sp. GSD1FS]|uniref:Methicillin resistance protein n=1 Tax=Bifidobacterium canis TaxID=2610880 RepID=A0A7K1J2N6_9BIFI|nr:methicillin resistance protein [Bifidobacterium canis]
MITIERVSPAVMEQEAQNNNIELPIEQTEVWEDFQAGIAGRRPWGALLVRSNDNLVAVISLIDMETHGYHYLRAMHGPVWKTKPTEAQEQAVIKALVSFVKSHDRHVAFLRIDTWFSNGTFPVLSTVPYNETVVLDVTGGDDAILARMKGRGRRDVRKALRESPAEIADETEKAAKDFSEYYAVMVETAKRDGFTPAPMTDYTDMIKALGPNHCHVFAARIDGKVVAWSLVTLQGKTGVYYYASMLTSVRRLHVPDKLLYSVACMLGEAGYEKLDLMGIGNDFAPSLKSLNEFKTKFTKETTQLAAGRDVPVKKTFYSMLRLLQSLRHKMQGKKQGNADKMAIKKAADQKAHEAAESKKAAKAAAHQERKSEKEAAAKAAPAQSTPAKATPTKSPEQATKPAAPVQPASSSSQSADSAAQPAPQQVAEADSKPASAQQESSQSDESTNK